MKRWLHNLIGGAGTLVDLMPPPLPPLTAGRKILAKSDAQALYEDWEKIGQDFWTALGRAKAEVNGDGQQPNRPEPADSRPAA